MAVKIGCTAETRRWWLRRHEFDAGHREGLQTAERDRLKALEREVHKPRKANEILRLASAFFAQAEPRSSLQVMRAFIGQYRESFGGLPICQVLQIAPSGIGSMLLSDGIPRTMECQGAARCGPVSIAEKSPGLAAAWLIIVFCTDMATLADSAGSASEWPPDRLYV